MILATTTFADYDTFIDVFSTKGAEKRALHGCQGARVFRDPAQADRVWVIFDWDEAGWTSFVTDPEVPGVMQAAGHTSKPQVVAMDREVHA